LPSQAHYKGVQIRAPGAFMEVDSCKTLGPEAKKEAMDVEVNLEHSTVSNSGTREEPRNYMERITLPNIGL